jgi:hypothetical protein
MAVTDDYSNRIVRLPLWVGLPADAPLQVVGRVVEVLTAPTAR